MVREENSTWAPWMMPTSNVLYLPAAVLPNMDDFGFRHTVRRIRFDATTSLVALKSISALHWSSLGPESSVGWVPYRCEAGIFLTNMDCLCVALAWRDRPLLTRSHVKHKTADILQLVDGASMPMESENHLALRTCPISSVVRMNMGNSYSWCHVQVVKSCRTVPDSPSTTADYRLLAMDSGVSAVTLRHPPEKRLDVKCLMGRREQDEITSQW